MALISLPLCISLTILPSGNICSKFLLPRWRSGFRILVNPVMGVQFGIHWEIWSFQYLLFYLHMKSMKTDCTVLAFSDQIALLRSSRNSTLLLVNLFWTRGLGQLYAPRPEVCSSLIIEWDVDKRYPYSAMNVPNQPLTDSPRIISHRSLLLLLSNILGDLGLELIARHCAPRFVSFKTTTKLSISNDKDTMTTELWLARYIISCSQPVIFRNTLFRKSSS